MDPDFWLDRWERSETGFHQNDVNPHLRQHWPAVKTPAGTTVFVPLAGKSKDMLWLAEQGYHVLGNEISPIAVEAFFAENCLIPERMRAGAFEHWKADRIELLSGDYFDLEPADLHGVGAVFDRASLVALPPQMRRRYARHMVELLQGAAPILLVTMEYPEGEMEGPPHSVEAGEVEELYNGDYDVQLLETADALEEHTHLRDRGLTSLIERVYLLTPKR